MAGAIAGVSASALLAIVEQWAPVILKALQPVLNDIWTKLSAGMVSLNPISPAVTVETAVAANLVKKMPAVTAAEYAHIKTQIGEAIAVYATEHPDDDLQGDVAWVDIAARAYLGIAQEGLVTADLPRSTFQQMLMSGLEMYRAGLGLKALAVEK